MTSSGDRPRALAAWRDVDSHRRRFGFTVWLTGGEVRIGRRLYRVRWAFRG